MLHLTGGERAERVTFSELYAQMHAFIAASRHTLDLHKFEAERQKLEKWFIEHGLDVDFTES